MAEPSPITKPSREASKGREAVSGCRSGWTGPASRRKPEIGSGWIAARCLRPTTMSARPDRISSSPVARASAPEPQAETGVCAPAWHRARRDRAGGAVGHQHRDRQREHPAGSLLPQRVVGGQQGPQPTPIPRNRSPRAAPVRSTGRPRAARPPWPRSSRNWPEGSSGGSPAGRAPHWSEPSTRAAKRTGSRTTSTQEWVMDRTLECPSSAAAHVLCASPPSGVVAPKPVTTTRRFVLLLMVSLCSHRGVRCRGVR
jgi:hypothetical protein